jgi:hypothetical protein
MKTLFIFHLRDGFVVLKGLEVSRDKILVVYSVVKLILMMHMLKVITTLLVGIDRFRNEPLTEKII